MFDAGATLSLEPHAMGRAHQALPISVGAKPDARSTAVTISCGKITLIRTSTRRKNADVSSTIDCTARERRALLLTHFRQLLTSFRPTTITAHLTPGSRQATTAAMLTLGDNVAANAVTDDLDVFGNETLEEHVDALMLLSTAFLRLTADHCRRSITGDACGCESPASFAPASMAWPSGS